MTSLVVGKPTEESTDVGRLATEQGRRRGRAGGRRCRQRGLNPVRRRAIRRAGSVPPADGRRRHHPGYANAHRGGFRAGGLALYRRRHRRGDCRGQRHPFGLGSNASTGNAGERARFVCDLGAGMVFINGWPPPNPELPFGSVKGSGYGRELSAPGIREFCNVKTVWIGGP